MIKTWSGNGEGKPTVACGIIFWFRKKKLVRWQVSSMCALLYAKWNAYKDFC